MKFEEIGYNTALQIQGGDYVESTLGLIYGLGAMSSITGIGIMPLFVVGATLLAYEAMVMYGL